jgi:hypothetical protein
MEIDELKINVEKLEKERKKVEYVLRNFLEMSAKNERSLLKSLANDLRRCEKFQTNYEI